ncbi:MAG TPA: elongation factor G [Nitrospirae bacterium]|nr:elongation factor G [bacterium BMS3Abin06]HDH12245.1 elongation factor G [Nitrospirota bacterium]HDZ01121.1 elongation factor G [Nitrospirota bacterium]
MSFDVGKIRNLAVIAHGGAGKTSLVEAILFDSGATERLGRIEDGNTVTDYEAEEINRKISISSAMAFCDWNGYRFNIIDTPGYINFIEDTKASLSVVDGAIVIVSALSGIKAETGKIWQFADNYEIPRIVFINKMDRENADFVNALEGIEKAYGVAAIPLNIPLGAESAFEGVIDLIKMKAVKFQDNAMTETDIPDAFRADAEEYRKKLVEKVAELDDALLEKYLEGSDPSDEEINKGIREGSVSGMFVPVVCGSATGNRGVHQLLDAAVLCLPSPAEKADRTPMKGKNPKTGEEVFRKPVADDPLSLRVFKTIADPFAGKLTLFRVFSGVLKPDSTVYNASSDSKEKMGNMFYLLGKKQAPVKELGPGEMAAVAKLKNAQTGDTLADPGNPVLFDPIRFADPMISYAIDPKSRGDEEKVSTGLQRLLEEDPTLKFHRDPESKEMILSGMGQMHLEVTLEKLKRKFGVEVIMKTPKIPYRETIKAASSAQGKYKKQSGGRGQFGDCWIKLEPLPRGSGFEFVNQIVGGAIPRQYIPAVEKGIVEKMKEGLIAGYPVIDIRATLYDGSYHNVDSSEMAFKIAGSMALQKAAQDAKPVILEPIVKIEVSTPEEFLGNVIGDLNAKRGKVQGVDSLPGGTQKVVALVPMAEMLTYANQLNSLTSGQGIYTMEASHYEEVPAHIARTIIAENEKAKKEG